MATLRARSESPLVGAGGELLRPDAPRPELYAATLARKRAEQDSILLANRLRLLRAEDEKTRKKIREAEKKTSEIIELRRRNEERRLMKEAEESRREAEEQELRARQMQDREEKHRKLQEMQQSVLDQRAASSAAVKQEREAGRHTIQEQRAEAEAELAARAERVRRSAAMATQSRARSEGAKQECAKSALRERLQREEEAQRARLGDIERMEREEAELIARLQHTQEQHRSAYLRLENEIQQSHAAGCGDAAARMARAVGSSRSTPQGMSAGMLGGQMRLPGTPGNRAAESCGPASASQVMGSLPGQASGSSVARPPRPRGAPATGAPSAAPPARAALALSGRQEGFPKPAKRTPTHAARAMSSCSTASGGDSGPGAASSSGRSTPSTPPGQQLTYTTTDGVQLDISPEEDLDLAALLNA